MTTKKRESGRWMSTGQVARRLGWDERTIRRRCKSRDIPGAMRIEAGGQWRIPAAWVEEVIKGAA